MLLAFGDTWGYPGAPPMADVLSTPRSILPLVRSRLTYPAREGLLEAGPERRLIASMIGPWAADVNDYLVIVARLAILAVLVLIGLGLARVLIAFKIEQRRKRRLAATRDIGALSPSDFEAYVAVLFEKAGYHVRRMGGSGDHGVDLLVNRGGTTSVVQCKRYEDAIGPSTIRELIGAMTNAGIKDGLLVATSGFTAGAQREAQKAPYRISLIDGDGLVGWARAYGLPGEVMGQG